MGDAIRLMGGNRNTLKQHFRALVEGEHLRSHGSGRGLVRDEVESFMPDNCPQNNKGVQHA
jgi:hypothetical protein